MIKPPTRRAGLVSLAAIALAALPLAAQAPPDRNGPGGRRAVEAGRVDLGFRQKPLDEQVLAFIAETTGKIVMPVGGLMTEHTPKITLLSGAPIERDRALDMLFQSLRLQGIGVIEKEDVVIIGRVEELMRLKRAPVLGASADIMAREDKSSLIFKVYRLTEVEAEDVASHLEEQLPEGAEMTVDPSSNQIILCGDIAACQQVQLLIDELDQNYRKAVTRIFVLQYADAGEIERHIEQLFPTDEGARSGAPPRGSARSARASRESSGARPGADVPVRIAVDAQQNNVTVLADPDTMARIADLVEHAWDLPRPFGTSKVYELRHTDPVKMRDVIREVLGLGSGSGSRTRVRGGGEGDVTETLSGIYRFEAFTDKNALVAICKTEEAFDFLDDLVSKLDQPSTLGLPVKISLRHADAGRLAEEINALLADGATSLSLAERGLEGGGLADRLGAGAGGGFDPGSGFDAGAGTAGEIALPWRPQPGDLAADRSPASNLIGHVRVVPIVRENALAVVAPPAHLAAMRELIETFDQPTRQVVVSATIAEIELTDDLVLGLRLSAGSPSLSTTENTLAAMFSGSASDAGFLGGLFETSVLDASFNLSVALQALAGYTDVRVLHQPRIFTADNEEAFFFDGQEVPFISDSNNFDSGGVNQSFSYRPVGLLLDVRPHITARRDVNLEVSIELSSIVPGQTLFGGFILDQRQARTNVTLSDGETVVISGLLREEESQIVRKVPLLGDIPLLGELFKSRENSTKSTELLVFLTPHVLDGAAETREHARPDLDQLEELSRPLDEQAPHEELRDDLRRRLIER